MAYFDNLEYNSKTQTLIGEKQRKLVDTDTGEVIMVDQVTKRIYGTKQFWKVYLMDFLSILGIFDSKQVDIFIHIVENTNPANNLFIGTYKKIEKATKISHGTVVSVMKKLRDNSFIHKIQNGVWSVNPTILMKGGENKRQILLNYFNEQESSKSDEDVDLEIHVKRTRAKEIKVESAPKEPPIEGQMSIDDIPLSQEQEGGQNHV